MTTATATHAGRLAFLWLVSILLSGCETISYYNQAIGGQLSLMMAGEPVEQLLEAEDTDPELRARLRLASDARRFARDELALPVGDAYTEYVDLERRWVLVNVIAAPEFSLEPRTWCYPFVGCQSYRGYFDPGMAKAKAQALRSQGYDTFIGGVTAYSTLGWFDDPLHTGFTSLPDGRMVALIFHELAHRVVYVDGDTAFNESFATAVELEGLRLWARERDSMAVFDRAMARLRNRNQTLELVNRIIRKLEDLYARKDNLAKEQLRERKSAVFEELINEYNAISEEWDQPGPLGESPSRLNNANLALFRQYNQYIPAFRQLLRDSNHDFETFYERVRALSEKPVEERHTRLSELGKRFSNGEEQ